MKLINLLKQQMANLLRKIDEDGLDEEEEEEEHVEEKLEEGGVLILNLKGANLERNTELMGKMDPYCIVKYLKKEYKSKVHNAGGKQPVWDDQF